MKINSLNKIIDSIFIDYKKDISMQNIGLNSMIVNINISSNDIDFCIYGWIPTPFLNIEFESNGSYINDISKYYDREIIWYIRFFDSNSIKEVRIIKDHEEIYLKYFHDKVLGDLIEIKKLHNKILKYTNITPKEFEGILRDYKLNDILNLQLNEKF
jgi:hypothetical protein